MSMEITNNYSNYSASYTSTVKAGESTKESGVTTSTGRVLDSVSAALEICNERTYEGEASMKLESAAYYSTNELELPMIIEKDTLNTTEILKEVVNLYLKGHKKADIANAAQKTIAVGLSELAIQSADKKGISFSIRRL